MAAVVRALVLGLVWVALSGAEADYALYGLVGVAAATALSLALLPPTRRRFRVRRLWFSVILAGWFLGKSVAGAADVARRALAIRPDIEPAVVSASLSLPPGPARQLALLMMNLMPGSMVQREVTASGQPADDADAITMSVELHTLSRSLRPAEQWDSLQRRVAAAFDVDVP